MIPVDLFISISAIMFAAGLYGVLTQKNAVRILISVEIMLNAANVAILGFNGAYGITNQVDGWVFALVIIAVAAAEAALGLAIFLAAFRNFGELSIANIYSLEEEIEIKEEF